MQKGVFHVEYSFFLSKFPRVVFFELCSTWNKAYWIKEVYGFVVFNVV